MNQQQRDIWLKNSRSGKAFRAAKRAVEIARSEGTAAGWIPVSERLPDDDLTVMIAMAESDEPWWLGYHSHGGWHCVDATQPASAVTHWKPMEAGPNG
jgi:hypothetical protein